METVSMKVYSLYSRMRRLEREFLMEFWIQIPREKKLKSMRVILKKEGKFFSRLWTLCAVNAASAKKSVISAQSEKP